MDSAGKKNTDRLIETSVEDDDLGAASDKMFAAGEEYRPEEDSAPRTNAVTWVTREEYRPEEDREGPLRSVNSRGSSAYKFFAPNGSVGEQHWQLLLKGPYK